MITKIISVIYIDIIIEMVADLMIENHCCDNRVDHY